MAKKRSSDGGGGGDDWLNTYADMVTLLLTFFAVLLSMSNTDEQKFNAFIKSFSNIPQAIIAEIIGADGDNPGDESVINDMEELYQSLKDYVESSPDKDSVDISKVDDIIYIRFNSALFFEPNEYTLRQASLPILSFIGDGIKEQEDTIKTISVIGHTATVIGGEHWMLSGERAAEVATYFDVGKKFDPKKLIVMGYGNQYPVATNETEDGRKQNRRVEMIIVGNDSDANFNVYDSLGNHFDDSQYPKEGSASDLRPETNQTAEATTESLIVGPTESPAIPDPTIPDLAEAETEISIDVSPFEG